MTALGGHAGGVCTDHVEFGIAPGDAELPVDLAVLVPPEGAAVTAGRLEVGGDLAPPGRPVDVVDVELAHEEGLADLLVRVGDPGPDQLLRLVQGQVGPVLGRVGMRRGEVQVRRLLETDEGIALVAAEAVLRAVSLDAGAEQVVGVDRP
ncbi:hypothetical protein [Streptomyces labedae]|uniref:hypothetical protein n=1 Tax=Streptomyces labedae TaxID=285569 RepID=UPI0031F998C6